MKQYLRAFCAALLFLSCSSSGGSSSSSSSSGSSGSTEPAKPNGPQLFSKAITKVVIEVDFVPGAEPYTGAAGDFPDIWSVFHANVLAVFDGKKDVTLPTTLGKMGQLSDVPAGDLSKQELLDLAESHRGSTSDVANHLQSYFIVFVNGHLKNDDGTVDDATLGVSIADSGVIAIFKPAYTSYFNKKSPTAELIEQLALTHYFGHAVGFVNNGVPLAKGNEAHFDSANGSHCTNKQCAMSAAFETAKGPTDYISKLPVSSDTIVLGQECLSDARILENLSQ
jgi:hypothetical protein